MGVACLSGAVDSAALTKGLGALQDLGFDAVCAANLESEAGMFAGSDGERLSGFHELLEDEEIGAVFFARGGHGLVRVLDQIDWDLLVRRPRWFVGYSDLTPLLMELVQRCGWQALHGPMVAVELADGIRSDEADSLLRALGGEAPSRLDLTGVDGSWGGVQGPLVGGCLSMIASTLGTRWTVSTEGTVLFLEDVSEPLYRIDRMLQQLRLAGVLDGVKGIVLGSFQPPEGSRFEVEDLVQSVREAAGVNVPLAWGCACGHGRPNLTLPLGAVATVAGGILRFPDAD